MNNPFLLRRVALLLLLIVTSLSACKKEADPAPAADVATRAAGQYTFSELMYGGKTLPASQTNIKGTIGITRQTEKTVSLDLNIRQKSDNSEFMVLTASNVEVAETSGTIAFIYEGQQVAKLTGNKLAINGEDADGVSFQLNATK